MTVAIVNYVRFKTRANVYTAYAYQNYTINQTRSYGGITYKYAPFVIAMAAGVKGGDRSENSIVFPDNILTTNFLTEAAMGGYLLESKSVALDPLTGDDSYIITDELWRISTLESDQELVTLKLQSPLDAVRGQVPRRVLSSSLVGALPTSSTLTTR